MKWWSTRDRLIQALPQPRLIRLTVMLMLVMSSNSRRHLLLFSHCVLGVEDADDTRCGFMMSNSRVVLAYYVDTEFLGERRNERSITCMSDLEGCTYHYVVSLQFCRL